MMTPKEKAIELVGKYRIILIKSETDAGEEALCTTLAKQCALIAVDEVIKHLIPDNSFPGYNEWFWQEVKQEIEKL